MNIAQLKNTVRNLITGKASGPEKIFIERCFHEAEKSSAQEEDMGQYDGRKSLVLGNLRKIVHKQKLIPSRPLLSEPDYSRSVKRLLPRMRGVAAAILLLVAGTGYLFRDKIIDIVSPLPIYAVTTNAYEVREIKLPDSSVVVINVNSTLRYTKSFRGKRKVELQGEAFFDIAKDPGLPFSVNGAHLNISVLGTSFTFSDSRYEEKASITLKTGSVKASANGSDLSFPILHPRQQLLYTAASGQGYIRNDVLATEPDWMNKILIFKGSKLKDVFTAIEKTYDTHIALANNAIADKLFTGSFIKGDSVSSIMKILSLSYGFNIRHSDGVFEIK